MEEPIRQTVVENTPPPRSTGPRLNGGVLISRKLIEQARAAMRSSVLRHRKSPAPESQKLGKDLEEMYLALGGALQAFDDRRDLWGDRLEPEPEVTPASNGTQAVVEGKS